VTEGPKGAKMLAQENIGAAKNGKIARIDYQLLLEREDMGLGLYLITLRQGLRHQIRVQLAAQGLPILGDRLYGGDWGERMYLHSLSYSLEYQGRPYQLVDKNLGDFDRLFDPDRIFQMLRDKAGIF
jgi:23S rRNA-/tRNA-specific pseudouridylate synthase